MGSTYVAEQLIISIVPLIQTFDFWVIYNFFLPLMGYFWGQGRVQKLFCVSSYRLITFVLSVFLYGVPVAGGGGPQRLLCLNPTTDMVMLLGLWLLSGCYNS